MAFISTAIGNIYYWAQCSTDDIEIPDAPGQFYEWNGSVWLLNTELQQQAIIASLIIALESHYDATARQRKYDTRLTCALRAGYAGPFQSEGQAFAIWMDNCNAYAYVVMDDCLAGTRTIPTAEALISELPVMMWPV